MRFPPVPRIAVVAAGVSLVLAIVAAVTAFAGGQFINLIAIPIFVIGGIGMLRRRAWSGYGLGLVQAAQLFAAAIAFLRDGWTLGHNPGAILLLIAIAGSAVLFFFTGRSLAMTGADAGHMLPWIVLASALGLPFLFLQPYDLPSPTMEKTLLRGDYLLVRRWPGFTPHRGDIVMCRYPLDPRQMFIRRIAGIPGDHISIVRKQLFVNGTPIQEPYADFQTNFIDPYRDNFPGVPPRKLNPAAVNMLRNHIDKGEILVPTGSYFLLGDSRDNSLDSRDIGFVAQSDVIGKPVMVYWSRTMPIYDDGTGGTIRWKRIFKLL